MLAHGPCVSAHETNLGEKFETCIAYHCLWVGFVRRVPLLARRFASGFEGRPHEPALRRPCFLIEPLFDSLSFLFILDLLPYNLATPCLPNLCTVQVDAHAEVLEALES